MWISAGKRRDVDDVATAALLHMRNRFVAAVEDSEDIGFENCAKVLRRHRFNGFEDTDACIVDENIKAAQFFGRVIDE